MEDQIATQPRLLADRIAAALAQDAGEDPLYRRLARAMRLLIAASEMKNNDNLPSERRLAEVTGLSRVTVRKALTALAEEGIIGRRAGARAHVVKDIDQSLSVLIGFTADMRRRGADGRSILLSQDVGLPTPDEVILLGISPTDKVMRLSRVRLAEDEPGSADI
ncbi:GntR family transcriptional regulator [Ketogulonicigenium robustum]|uniref:GntR family transcriptional regulator n=1 Tax=Ketogulonicigenium robustum TaxID=92947 RepID=A0A1W6NWW4_9RHOB|nr:GntR family transcriptional regulator [Ketogulonicigenium robustum]ARO13391.1 UbiC transcription regulator-associated domain protein [Ketogulonicigenium robustum]ARO13643.1 UbiC transcription regulator-associated domain protein [Ketogulonicigenium robustum]ARO13827.1 UbiC transcription regulator-associated domain protein [Ketogulonicigenium robustum]ARO13852.1 GntR family transcriptional regulator [Ketogulonicigenium robustum]